MYSSLFAWECCGILGLPRQLSWVNNGRCFELLPDIRLLNSLLSCGICEIVLLTRKIHQHYSNFSWHDDGARRQWPECAVCFQQGGRAPLETAIGLKEQLTSRDQRIEYLLGSGRPGLVGWGLFWRCVLRFGVFLEVEVVSHSRLVLARPVSGQSLRSQKQARALLGARKPPRKSSDA